MGATITISGGSRAAQLEAVRNIINEGECTHYVVTARTIEIFRVEPCERCGVDTMLPDERGLVGVDEDTLLSLGLIRLEHLPAEVDVTEDGEYCCTECN